ncbi:DNA repair protein RecN [Williamsia sterculiae]|uniref:DNA repair protein RecN n=1 Tax=Williamsia sterculiae TaxID=1344003 RepID=A0A1N7H443_9NOCA|nr:DNA repair protein RecN [Williamsia sterculiae]SIS19596.1 DNA repair protein RecN (Recombination protein N) [Williamsia sterculiae]
MLDELAISGLGVIDEATAEFPDGFTVLTGETGAGKTMVVTSLHLLSGARADASRVRTGAQRATVEGRFRITTAVEETDTLLDSAGAERDDDDSVIAARSVNGEGRSRAHLGGRSVPAGVLGQFTRGLLTIHGQNDQLRLIKAEHQRAALDRFGGEAVGKALRTYRTARDRWVAATDAYTERRNNSRELAQEVDRLRFAVDEIAAVDPQPGEDATIAADILRLGDLETVRTAAATAHATAVGTDDAIDGGSVLNGLGEVRSALESVGDPTLQGLLPRVQEALTVVGDLAAELGDFLSGLPTDASELEKLLTRQAELRSLVRKYAPDIDGVIGWRRDAEARLDTLGDPDTSLDELEAAAGAAADELAGAAVALTQARTKAAKNLSAAVSAELAGLAMGDAVIDVRVGPDVAGDGDPRTLAVRGSHLHAGRHGVDRVEFAMAAHPGAPPLPIGKSASGGELSRVMLALEVVLASDDTGSTMVFDEVDAGVGGHAAVEIGRRLARLARHHQVIVVTHLPQVAAFADNHLLIGKTDRRTGRKTSVTSSVSTLDRDDRINELARMLAGLGDSETGRAHAEELLDTADTEKAAD